jgi:hypothetical protein
MGGFIGLCHGRMLISAHGRKSETSIPLPAGTPDTTTNAQCCVRVERRIHPAGVQSARVAAG